MAEVDNTWAYLLGKKIYSTVSYKAENMLKDDYPDIRITDNGKANSKPKFPTVYIHELPGQEIWQTLDGQDINGVLETIQVDVTTNTDPSDARKVMSVVADIFKKMRFKVNQMPELDFGEEVYRSTARFQRVVGANDTL